MSTYTDRQIHTRRGRIITACHKSHHNLHHFPSSKFHYIHSIGRSLDCSRNFTQRTSDDNSTCSQINRLYCNTTNDTTIGISYVDYEHRTLSGEAYPMDHKVTFLDEVFGICPSLIFADKVRHILDLDAERLHCAAVRNCPSTSCSSFCRLTQCADSAGSSCATSGCSPHSWFGARWCSVVYYC